MLVLIETGYDYRIWITAIELNVTVLDMALIY